MMIRQLTSSKLFQRPLLTPFRGYASAVKPATLVLVEHKGAKVDPGTFNAISAAKKIGNPISYLIPATSTSDATPIIEQLKKFNASEILVASHDSFKSNPVPEILSSFIEKAQSEKGFSHIVASHGAFYKNVLPRTSAIMNVAPVADIIAIENVDTFQRPIYAGNAICTVRCNDPVKILTVRTTAFAAAAPEAASNPNVEEIKVETVQSDLSEFVKEELQKSDRPELGSARVVVGGGRGLKSGENFKILYELADKLGGTVGASRAAVDAGFVDNSLQIGQTGKVIAPELYIACGISGAIQHLAGMKDSKTIVAINKDGDAPIFQVADYGLEADLFQAVPELTKKL